MSEALAAVLVEAFSEGPGAGNGAAVVRLEQPLPAAWMQAVAASLRQSETAFLLPRGSDWLLRWFTPGCEVPLCGHATLAAVLALGHWGLLAPGEERRLHSRSGPLAVRLQRPPLPRRAGRAAIELPGGGLQAAEPPPGLVELLRGRLGVAAERFWHSSLGYSVALVDAGADLGRLQGLAADLPAQLRDGLVVMQAVLRQEAATPRLEGESADYRLRFFAPGLGIDEDPVTGSAHALVAPWWQERLGKGRVVGWQCSDRPGGMLCEATSSGTIRLTGSGHLLWDGTLLARPEPCESGSSESVAWFSLGCGS